MTFKQWWDGIEWGFAARILFKPIGQLFAEMAWNAAVKAEREACAKVADGWPDYDVQGLAEAIRARGKNT